jgi:hypothetical protein
MKQKMVHIFLNLPGKIPKVLPHSAQVVGKISNKYQAMEIMHFAWLSLETLIFRKE